MEQTLTLSYSSLGALIAILTFVVGIATGALGLYVKSKMLESEGRMMEAIKREFQNKELSAQIQKDFEARLSKLEGWKESVATQKV